MSVVAVERKGIGAKAIARASDLLKALNHVKVLAQLVAEYAKEEGWILASELRECYACRQCREDGTPCRLTREGTFDGSDCANKCPYNNVPCAIDRLPAHTVDFRTAQVCWHTLRAADSPFTELYQSTFVFSHDGFFVCDWFSLADVGRAYDAHKNSKYLDSTTVEELEYFRSVQRYAKKNYLKAADVRILSFYYP